MSIELVMPSNHLIFCCPLLLPSVFPSIKVFASESAIHIRWPKYWSFSFSINEYSGLIFFRIDWFDVLGLQGTLESLLHRLTMNLSSVNSVQSLSRVLLFATPWTAAHQASLSITKSQSLLKLMSIESVIQSNHLILCHPLLLLPSIFPSIMVFSNESVLCIRWPKYSSFSSDVSPSNEYSGLISFRVDWLDLLEV